MTTPPLPEVLRRLDDAVRGARHASDLLGISEDALDRLRSVSGLAHAYRVQARKARNARAGTAWWHRWRAGRLADKLRERLGLGPLDPLPATVTAPAQR